MDYMGDIFSFSRCGIVSWTIWRQVLHFSRCATIYFPLPKNVWRW